MTNTEAITIALTELGKSPEAIRIKIQAAEANLPGVGLRPIRLQPGMKNERDYIEGLKQAQVAIDNLPLNIRRAVLKGIGSQIRRMASRN